MYKQTVQLEIISVNQTKTKIELVISQIEHQIKNRSLTPGTRLPSVRKLAKDLGFSVSTIVEAYERLIALGKIESRSGSGFYVVAPLAPLALSELGPKLDRSIDPLWISRQSLEAESNAFKPGCGWLPNDWMPLESRLLGNQVQLFPLPVYSGSMADFSLMDSRACFICSLF